MYGSVVVQENLLVLHDGASLVSRNYWSEAIAWWWRIVSGGAGTSCESRIVSVELSFPLIREREGWAMKRREFSSPKPGAAGFVHLAPVETVLFKSLPLLVEHLAVTKYEDGTPRRPGRIFLETMGASWILVLKEPDTKLEMRVVGATVDDALCLAELLLGTEDPPWMPDTWAQDRASPTRKK